MCDVEVRGQTGILFFRSLPPCFLRRSPRRLKQLASEPHGFTSVCLADAGPVNLCSFLHTPVGVVLCECKADVAVSAPDTVKAPGTPGKGGNPYREFITSPAFCLPPAQFYSSSTKLASLLLPLARRIPTQASAFFPSIWNAPTLLDSVYPLPLSALSALRAPRCPQPHLVTPRILALSSLTLICSSSKTWS